MATTKVHAPNEEFTGTIAGVGFANGVGEIDKKDTGLLDWFRRKGYRVGTTSGGTAKSTKGPSIADLRDQAKAAGVKGYGRMKKAELQKALEGVE